MDVEEKAHELWQAQHGVPGQTAPPDREEIVDALREAREDGARRAASYASREASTILQQHGVDPALVATLCQLYNRVGEEPGVVLDHDEEDDTDG